LYDPSKKGVIIQSYVIFDEKVSGSTLLISPSCVIPLDSTSSVNLEEELDSTQPTHVEIFHDVVEYIHDEIFDDVVEYIHDEIAIETFSIGERCRLKWATKTIHAIGVDVSVVAIDVGVAKNSKRTHNQKQ
jgi:hypothetical protein